MSDHHATSGEQARLSGVGNDDADLKATAGFLLQRAREASGLTIAVLALTLKVPVKKLEALEQDRLDLLPDAVFARALASSVCRSLKLNPGPVLERLPQMRFSVSSFGEQRAAVPYKLATRRQHWPVFDQVSRTALTLGLALLAGTVLLIYLPEIQSVGRLAQRELQSSDAIHASANQNFSGIQRAGPASTAAAVLNGKLADAPSVMAVRADMDATSFNRVAAQSSNLLSGASDQNARASTSESSAGPELVSQSSILSSEASTSIVSSLLTLTARKESWVKVTDAKGRVLLSRLLAPGEVVKAFGVPPLEAVVGRADAMHVEVRGKWLDLVPLSRENVARFEVK